MPFEFGLVDGFAHALEDGEVDGVFGRLSSNCVDDSLDLEDRALPIRLEPFEPVRLVLGAEWRATQQSLTSRRCGCSG